MNRRPFQMEGWSLQMVWELVCWIILLFFTLLGIAVSIYLLLFRVITPAGKREYLLLMPSDCPGDAVSEIYAAQLRAELLGHKQCGGVLVILNGMDDETTAQCKAACHACSRVHICTLEELQQHFGPPQ